MKKIRKRVFAAVLVALMLVTAIPSTALYASSETEGADLSSCKGEKTEVQEVTREKVITAWEWIDPEEYLTDGMLALPGARRENPAFAEDVTALLPEKIQAKAAAVTVAEDGEETEEDAEALSQEEGMEIALAGWECASYPEDGAYEGTYTFTASLPEGFVLAEGVAALEVKVELGGAEMLLGSEVSAAYQEAAWNGSEVTYTGKTETCTPVESSADAVTWDAGWYVVNSTVTISEPITVTGAVNLILADGCTLTAGKGIVVETSNSLTIYAQSVGTGTLNATGTDSAGIGGAGRTDYGVDGGSSGAITIHGGNITATSQNGAGIGGGAPWSGANGGSGSNITIYGGSVTAQSTGTMGGAGIGGGGSGTIVDSSHKSGSGTGITISGGNVTAVGGQYAAGIGGGGGYYYSNSYQGITFSGGCTGGTGNVTISGGIVDASSPTDVNYSDYKGAPIGNGGNTSEAATVNKTTGIVFENGAGTVWGDVTFDGNFSVPGDYTLNIPAGASLSGSGTLSGGSAFTTENLTVDMISVPTDLYYTGKDRTEDITTELSGELDKGVTICGQTFTVSGWTLAVEKTGDLIYTATYTNNNDNTNTFTKTITLLKSGTKFEGDVKTYNGDTQTTTFNADDTITVKATPTATGTAPAKAATRLRGGYTAPTAGQMALFVGDVQVSDPVQAGEGGTYTMTVSAAEVLLQGNAESNGDAITLTAKFVGNDNMADAAGTVDVRISAVAKAELDGKVIGYYGESNLDKAFANDGATVILLDNITTSMHIGVDTGNLTLDLNGKTITKPASYGLYVAGSGHLTIRGNGKVICTGTSGSYPEAITSVGGTLTLEGGTFIGLMYGVRVDWETSVLSVTGESVSIQGERYGLRVAQAQSVQLSAGTYNSISVYSSNTLASLLAENCAYYKGSTPIRLSELADQKELTGTVTVQECQHTGVEAVDLGEGKHGLTCPYCGYSCSHDTILTATTSDTVITVNKECETDGCGYSEKLGSAVFTFENLTYKHPSAKVSWTKDGPTTLGVMVKIDNASNYAAQSEEATHSCSLTNPDADAGTPVTAGQHTMKVLFYDDYSSDDTAECELTFSITPATLTSDMVTLDKTEVTYNGQSQKSTLTVRHGETTLTEGTGYEVSYTRDGTVTTDLTSAGTVTITITGKGNYQGEVVKTFTIKKVKPSLSVEKAEITYGEALYESALTAKAQDDSQNEIAGTFTWKDRFVKPAVSDSGTTKYTVVFTPEDEKNYDSVETEVAITVSKAKNPPKKPGSTMNVSENCSKVSDIVLPEGWKWQDSDMNTALSAGETITVTAEYTGADSENYEKTTAEVEITRSECSHVPGDFLYTQEGEKEPTCTKEGLGHRECTVCGAVVESEAAVPALGHNYTETVTKEPTTEHEGVKTYTCSRCHDTYTESIPKLTGGGSAGGGGSASGNGTVVTPEVPDTFTETVTKTNSAGKTVVVTTTIKYGSNQSILSKTVKSVIEQAAVNTAVTVTVKTDKNGKTTVSATVVKTKTAAEKEKENTISAAVVSQIKEAAGTADVMITWKVKGADGKTKYTIKVNAKDVKNGSVLKIMKTDPKTGEYILVNAKNYPVTKNGNVSVTVDKKGTYILLSKADAKKYSDAIKKSIKVKDALKSIKAGQKTTIALNGKTNKDNIKKITYTSTDKSIASVDKKGRITAKKKGTVTIKAKVTLKNGVTKTVKMKVKVK